MLISPTRLQSSSVPTRSLRRRITLDNEDCDELVTASHKANLDHSPEEREFTTNSSSARRFLSGSSVGDAEEYQDCIAIENGDGDGEMVPLVEEQESDNDSHPERRRFHQHDRAANGPAYVDVSHHSSLAYDDYRQQDWKSPASTQSTSAHRPAPRRTLSSFDYSLPPTRQRDPSATQSSAQVDNLTFKNEPTLSPRSVSFASQRKAQDNNQHWPTRTASTSRRFLSVDSDEDLPSLVHDRSSPEPSEDGEELEAFYGLNPFGRNGKGENDEDWEIAMDDEEVMNIEEDSKGKRRMIEQDEDEEQQEEVEMDRLPIYQLQRISDSPDYEDDASIEDRRSIIINSLECMTLSVLQQLVESALPPLIPPTDSQNDSQSQSYSQSHSQSQRVFEDEDDNSDESISESQQIKRRGRRNRAPKDAKSTGITVVLAKRGGSSTAPDSNTGTTRKLRLPTTRSSKEPNCGSHELAILLFIVDVVLTGLRENVVVTKRDIFYRNVALFKKQTVVDSIVEDIAATLQIRRSELNVVAAAKGLFAGNIVITGSDGNRISGGMQGALIPPSQSIAEIEVDDVEWILIIEKEAVFRSLCVTEFLNHPKFAKGIMITGKGFPDIATRELVKQLSIDLPDVPILALLDADPYGLQILSTFVHGSAAMRYDDENLAVPSIEWMGLKATEWDQLGVGRESLLTLSGKERLFAMKLLRSRDWWDEEWRSELMYMIHLGRKAEIQILASLPRLSDSSQSQKNADSMLDSDGGDDDEERTFSSCPLINYVKVKISRRLEQ